MNTPSISFALRDARPEDATQIAELGALVFSATYGHSIKPHELKAYLKKSYSFEATMEDIANPLKDMIVATENADNRIVGFGLLTRSSTELCIRHMDNIVELQRLYIHPAYRSKGIGRSLAERLETVAIQQHFFHIWLGVWEENQNAMTLYEKWGYKKIGERDFSVGTITQVGYILIKKL
ncbi:acetyltransferase [Microthyrium microscopicum]|uniref:Acetyltransferase n=1 Tax=Microthyrium microscopicum TaxID=703497 RepID=A0A6A6TTQ9_9PEZI|nr:acetyltransferase [Microthyrium microscopicum]